MTFSTCDLADEHGTAVKAAEPLFRHYGGARQFHGEIVTLRLFEDNALVRTRLREPGMGKVLIVDGGASTRTALLGDLIGASAVQNGWRGVIINGAVRDVDALALLPLGILARASVPIRSAKDGVGDSNVPVTFAGVEFVPGQFVYADATGIIVSATRLIAEI